MMKEMKDMGPITVEMEKDVNRLLLITDRFGKIGSMPNLEEKNIIELVENMMDYIMDSTTDGAYFAAQEFEPKLYARGYRAVFEHLGSLMDTLVPVVVFTCWAEDEKDRKQKQGERAGDVPSHIMPALPGQLAKKIMGEFSVVVHQSVRKLVATDDKPQAVWQTRAAGDVWGASLKGPTGVVQKIPTYIAADYRILEKLWKEAEG